MVEAYCQGEEIVKQVPQTVFRAVSKANQTMLTKDFNKQFRVTADKRYLDGFDTRPYGYKRLE